MSRFNPHFPNAASVFDAAAKFKQRCLLDQQSLLLDGQTLWTTEHFQALIDNYVKQPDVGQGGGSTRSWLASWPPARRWTWR